MQGRVTADKDRHLAEAVPRQTISRHENGRDAGLGDRNLQRRKINCRGRDKSGRGNTILISDPGGEVAIALQNHLDPGFVERGRAKPEK
jgi:hypothetical protein